MSRLLAFGVLLLGVGMLGATDARIYPAYGSGFQRVTDGENVLLLRELLLELRGLRQDFAGLRQELLDLRAAGGGKVPEAVDGAKVIANSCMACHKHDNAQGGLILVDKDGNLAELSVDQRYRNERRVVGGSMPPAKDKQGRALRPLSNQEKTAALAIIGPVKPEEAKK